MKNMRWSINWKPIKSNGLEFENLINDLLKLMFPDNEFKHTKETRDGGKDFILITSNESTKKNLENKVWAECKNYEDKLATSDIAKTFVMAIAFKIKEVLIFSRSEITQDSLKEIALFKKQIKYRIKIIHGNILEKLLLTHQEKLQDNWPELFIKSNVAKPEEKWNINYYIVNKDNNEKNQNMSFFLRESVIINLYLHNRSIDDKGKTVNIIVNNISKELHFVSCDEIVDDINSIESKIEKLSKKISIDSGEVKSLEFKFRINKFARKIELPSITIKSESDVFQLPTRSITCTWIAEVPFFGNDSNSLNRIKNHIIPKNNFDIANIFGFGGTGKSRFLKEIIVRCEDLNQEVLFLSLKNKTINGEKFIKKIVAFLTELIYIDDFLDHSKIISATDELAYKILYDVNYNFKKNKKEIISYILQILIHKKRKEKIVLIIDDLQEADDIASELLQEIIIFSPQNLCIITSFNTELIFEQTIASALFNFCKIKSEHNYEIIGFSVDNALHYVKQCFGTEKIVQNEYEETLKLIVEKCGRNPLCLQQSLLFFAQKGVIQQSVEDYYEIEFFRLNEFHQILNKFVPEIGKIISHRHQYYLNNLNVKDRKIYELLIKLLCVFKSYSLEQYIQQFRDTKIYQTLINQGILAYDSTNGDISFYHRHLEIFYCESYYPNSNDAKNLLVKINASMKQGFPNPPIFILRCIANKIDKEEFRQATDLAKSTIGIDSRYKLNYLQHLFELSKNTKINIDKKIEFNVFETLFSYEIEYNGNRKVLQKYSNYINALIVIDNSNLCPNELIKICRTYIIATFQIPHNKTIIDFIKNAISKIETLEHTSNDIDSGLSSLYNGLSVAYLHFNKQNEAIFAIKKALEISEKANSYLRTIENLCDFGYIYYRNGNVDKLIYYWGIMYEVYKKHCKADSNWYLDIKCNIHSATLDLITKNYTEAYKKLKFIQKIINTEEVTIYYKIKYRLIMSIYLLAKNSKLSKEEENQFLRFINLSKDDCVRYCFERDYYKYFMMMALYNFYYKKDYKKALSDCLSTFNHLVDFTSTDTDINDRKQIDTNDLKMLEKTYKTDFLQISQLFHKIREKITDTRILPVNKLKSRELKDEIRNCSLKEVYGVISDFKNRYRFPKI